MKWLTHWLPYPRPKEVQLDPPIHMHVHIHMPPSATDPDLARMLRHLDHKLTQLTHMEARMTPQLQALTDKVSRNTTVQGSAILLMEGLSAALAAAKDDPAAIQALADQLGADSDRLAASIVTNTPAAAVEPPAVPTTGGSGTTEPAGDTPPAP